MMRIAIAIQLAALSATAAHAQTSLYGLTYDGQLLMIDTSTGHGTFVANTGLPSCDAMAADALGRLFAIASNDLLYRIDPVHGCATYVGDVSGVEYVEDLAFSPTGILFGAGSTDADVGAEVLIIIDTLSAQSSIVGPFVAADDVDAMGWRTADGIIYGSDLNSERWLSINPATGQAVDLGPQPDHLFALTFSAAGVLFGTRHASNASTAPSTLVTLSLAGEATTVGGVGFSAVTGLAFIPSRPDCPGDVTSDLAVDLADLAILLAYFGTLSGASACQGDLNGDGGVDLADLALLLAYFGATCQ